MTSISPSTRGPVEHSISIVIITHNRQREAMCAVRSARAQSVPALEIIVVDDGSSRPFKLDDLTTVGEPPVRLVRNEKALGPSGARNRGINAASGNWIAFLDDDDQFEPEKLEVVGRSITQHGFETEAFYHPARILMLNEGVEYVSSPPISVGRGATFKGLLVKNIVGGTAMVVSRKTALESAGLFDESLRALEDYELWLRMAKNGSRFRFIADPLTRYGCTTARSSVTQSAAAGIETFRQINNTYAADFAALTRREKCEHAMWIHEIELQRAMLRLDYFGTIQLAWRLLFTFPRFKYAAALVASLWGPKTMIRIRSRRSK